METAPEAIPARFFFAQKPRENGCLERLTVG
jgi:hypothetical protein